MTRRLYAAGVAILATLLLSSAVGAEPAWVDVGGTVHEAEPQALSAPTEAAAISVSAGQPPLMGADALDYVYIDPAHYGVNVFPWYYYYTGFRYQQLYLASEIGRDGTIAQIALFKTAYAYKSTFPNVSIKLCHTNVTSLTTTFATNYGGNSPVWVYHQTSGFLRGTDVANMWDTVDLKTPFDYNGTDNLLVEVVWIGAASGTYPGSKFNVGSGNRRAYARDITDTLQPTADRADDFLLNTRLQFLDVGEATIVLDPKKLKLKKPDKWLSCCAGLPEELSVDDIDPTTVAISAIDGELLARPLHQTGTTTVDNDNNELTVEFDQQELIDILIAMGYRDKDEPVLTVTGILPGIATFTGSDVIKLSGKEDGSQGSAAADLPKSLGMQLGSPLLSRGIVVQYALPVAGNVSLELYDVSGALAKTVACGYVLPGSHAVSLSREGLARGAYILKLQSGASSVTRKLVIE